MAVGAVALLTTIAGALLVVGVPSRPSSPDNLPIMLGDEPVRVGAVIDARDETRVLRFTQGSRATWTKGASGSLSRVDPDAIELKLAEGTLELDVEKKAGRRWSVVAGNFRVYVIGTAFTVSRDASTEEFRLVVKRGKVRIQGPELQGGEVHLNGGEEFGWRPRARPAASSNSPSDQEVVSEPKREEARAVAPPPPSTTASGRALDKNHESWQSLALAGKYKLAIESVQNRGTASVLLAASPEDRVLLGNAARYSGHVDLSNRAYRAARDVPGPSATLAAYYLAKVALDSSGDRAQAIVWLQTYLKEAPAGDLSASARARLMSLLSASGRVPEAQGVARDYLQMHPGGPQAKMAKQLLDRR